jgi:hypothetical protein
MDVLRGTLMALQSNEVSEDVAAWPQDCSAWSCQVSGDSGGLFLFLCVSGCIICLNQVGLHTFLRGPTPGAASTELQSTRLWARSELSYRVGSTPVHQSYRRGSPQSLHNCLGTARKDLRHPGPQGRGRWDGLRPVPLKHLV